ncbi:hypothetical protein [Halorussus salinus]|uniref:hypothetical protein n=1 Tax=Halorussus salinus TaxID=1364935 RepID=UPI001091E87D|nr:hypothetical protein [Halorussus salinus]
MQNLQTRRSILRKGAKATVAAVGAAGLTGNAAAAGDYGISITHESGSGSGYYEVRVPLGGDSEVNGSSNIESDDTVTIDDASNEAVITGSVSSTDTGDYWSTKNTGEPYVEDSSNCSITIA